MCMVIIMHALPMSSNTDAHLCMPPIHGVATVLQAVMMAYPGQASSLQGTHGPFTPTGRSPSSSAPQGLPENRCNSEGTCAQMASQSDEILLHRLLGVLNLGASPAPGASPVHAPGHRPPAGL
jgi:hypothetical protein